MMERKKMKKGQSFAMLKNGDQLIDAFRGFSSGFASQCWNFTGMQFVYSIYRAER
jgi:hypothetical protein